MIRWKKNIVLFFTVMSLVVLHPFSSNAASLFELNSESIFNNTINGRWNYIYNSSGRVVQSVSPSGQIIDYQYDANGNMTKRIKSDNLLVNPSYEVITNPGGIADGWSKVVTGGTNTIQLVQTPVTSGMYAERISGTEISKDNVVGIYQLIKLEGNNPFSLNGRVHVAALVNAKAQFYVEFYSDPAHIIGVSLVDDDITSTGNFMTLSLNGTIPSKATFAKINILLRATANDASGDFYVDTMNFQYTAQGNMLSNPDYEVNEKRLPVADNWSKLVTAGVDTIQLVQAPVFSGLNAERISGTGISKDNVIGIYQLVKVEENKAFSLDGRVHIAALVKAKAQFYIEFYSDPNHIVAVHLVDGSSITNGSYSTLSINGTVPANATFAKINILLRATANDASGTFYVDGMSFK